MLKKQKNVQAETLVDTDMPKKKKEKKLLWGIFGGLLLMLVAVGLYLFIPRQQEQVVTEELVDCPIYWNVDREKYQPKLGGLSTRQPEADGIYTMRFLTRGEIVEYRVKDKELMLTIDSEDAMGLLVDEDGFVTEYVELYRMGVREVAKWYYVLRPKEDGATINTSTIGNGVNVEIKWQDDTGFWDITNQEDYGCATELQLLDAVRAFNNADGEITDVFVVEREPSLAGLSPDQYCPHCDEVVEWKMWAFLDKFPTGEGHYWVVHDINMKQQYSMAKGTKQCVNLNGRTITATHKSRIVSLHNEGVELAIMDLSKEQTGTLKGMGDGGYGSIVWVRFGTFSLYGGTLDASEVVTASPGGAVSVFSKDCVFNMYGGTVIGATVQAKVTDDKVSDAVAAAVAVKGTVNMYGGTIRDGKCVTAKDSNGKKGASAGGNIFVYGGGTFNMHDGLISGGTIVDNQGAFGGNIRIAAGGVWNMHGGVIEKGVSFNKGGNISLFGTLNMTGGVIRGGKVYKDGETLKDAKLDKDCISNNLHMQTGELNMSGGTIEGYVEILNNSIKRCVLNISGTAKIAGAKSNLTMTPNDVINMGQLKKGAKISISGGGFVTNKTKESNCKYVFSDYDADVLYADGRIVIGKYSCICGKEEHVGKCDGTKLAWAPWPNDSIAPTASGNWYLLQDVDLKKQLTLGKDTELNLDLNGFNIAGQYGKEGTRVYSLRNDNVTMRLTDLSADKDGRIISQGTGSSVGYGNCVWVAKDSELHMYGGCLDASKVEIGVGGAAVQVQAGCKLYMYDGSILGGNTEASGGAVAVTGEFEMHGGVVSGGVSKDCGGNIFVAKEGEFRLYGGEVRNGEAANYGGNLGGIGHIKISGGIVSGGQADHGGNIWVKQRLTVEGGSIINGNASTGGNIFAPQDVILTITGGTVSDGVAALQGGNIRVLARAKTVVKNAIIRNGQAGELGGNIFMNGGTFTMENSKITDGTVTDGLGANIYVVRQKMGSLEEDSTLNLKSGSIDGEIYLHNGKAHTLNLFGDVKVGISEADDSKPYGISWSGDLDINGTKVNEDANVVIGTISNLAVSGTGDERAFTILDKEVSRRNAITDDSNGDGIGELRVTAKMCVCGATDGKFNHTDSCEQPANAWKPWSDDILPTAEGSYYLTKDITLARRGDIKENATVNLDLAGYTASGHGWNGGVYRVQKGTLNLADSSTEHTGTIKVQNATGGGNGLALYVWGNQGTSVANIFGGTLTAEGETGNNGTTVSIHNGTINMYDGTIIPGTSTAGSNSVQIGVASGSLATFNAKGGTIKGEVLLYNNNATLSIAGDAKVGIADGAKAYGIAVESTVASPCMITCTDVTEQESVVLKNLVNLEVTGTGDESAFKLLDTTSRNKIADDKEDGSGNLSAVAHMCVCGAMDGKYDHTASCRQPETVWQPWSSDILPNVAGSYYLTGDITLARRGDITNGITVNLDLAGYTASGHGWNGGVYRVQEGTLNIADSSQNKTGAIKVQNATNGGNGLALYVWGNNGTSVANIFGGTLSAEGETGNNGTTVSIHLGTVNMYDGTIIPGTSTDGSNSVQVGVAAGSTPTLNVEGGTIKGEVLLYNDNATLSIAGDAKVGIADGEKAYGIAAASAVTSPRIITCTDITEQASVVLKNLVNLDVTGTGKASAFTVLDTESRNTIIDNKDDGIENFNTVGYTCVCGIRDGQYNHTASCRQPISGWQPWTSTTSLPTNGSYYLTQNLTGVAARAQMPDGSNVDLDLAGYTLEGPGNGGNFFMIRRGTLNIADTSKEGTGAITMTGTTPGFGAVYVWGAGGDATYLNIFGGTFSAVAGNPVTVSRGEINMYGGTILPGTKAELVLSTTNTANNFIGANSVQVGLNSTAKANLNVLGGTIKGEVLIGNNTNAKITISGDAKVGIADGDKAYGIGITDKITSAQTITFNNANGQIVLKDTNNLTLSGTGDASKITILDKHNQVVDDNAQGIGNISVVAYMCVCGATDGKYNHTVSCKQPESAWQAWTTATALPATAGSYYLTSNVTVSSTISPQAQKINLDLAGHTVDGQGSVAQLIQPMKTTVINIADSVGNGVIKNAYQGQATAYGTVILLPGGAVNKDACVNLYAGKLTSAGGAVGINTAAVATVYVGTGTFNMYGGTVEDNLGEGTFMAVRNSSGTFNRVAGTLVGQ